MATIAITGSNGFIGTHLIRELDESGHNFILIDLENGYDVTNIETLKDLPRFDVAIHLAARTFIPDSFKNPAPFFNTNLIGTVNMLDLCRLYGAKMIYVSSFVYGHPEYLPIDENHPVLPANPYTLSKILSEQLCQGYNRDFDVPVVIFRPFNLFGAGQNSNFLIPRVISHALKGAVHLDDPNPKRDFIYIDDLIDAFVKAIDYDAKRFDVFNLGSGVSHSVREIAAMIVSEFNPDASINFSGKVRKNEVMDTVADVSKAAMALNWYPGISMLEGIRKIKAEIQ